MYVIIVMVCLQVFKLPSMELLLDKDIKCNMLLGYGCAMLVTRAIGWK